MVHAMGDSRVRAEHSGKSRRPIAINEQSIGDLKRILDDIREGIFRDVASIHSVQLAQVRELASKVKIPLVAPEYPSEYDRDTIEAYEKKSIKHRLLEKVRYDLLSRTSFSASVGYDSGSTFQSDSLSGLTDTLRAEPGIIDNVSISFGDRIGTPHLSLRLYNSWTTAYFSISGERKDADHAILALNKWLRASEPDQPLLHNRIALNVPVIILAGIGSSALTLGLTRLMGGQLTTQESIAAIIISGAFSGSILMFLVKEIERAFPKLQIELGPEWKRVRARRTRLLFVISAILIPIVLTLLMD
jgi:hypothetical protein